MEKKLITAIALSILIIVGFQYLAPKPVPPAPATQPAAAVSPKGADITPVVETQNLPEEKELEVATEKYVLTFSNTGGALKDVRLAGYKNLHSKEMLELVRITKPKDYIFNMSDLMGTQIFDLIEYKPKSEGLTLTYTAATKDYEIRKKYTLRKANYGIDLEISIKNISSTPKELAYSIIGGAGFIEKNDQDRRLVEAAAKMDGKIGAIKRPKRGERLTTLGMVGWEALKARYFSIVLKPFAQTRGAFSLEESDGSLLIGVDSERAKIEPGATITHKYAMYVGPSSIEVLKEFGYGVEESVNYGMFGGISKVLIAAMRLFYAAVHNWGIAIIILSVLLNVVLFPLTMKSFKSMQKMQELHPQMEKLKVQFKDNPQKLNKEIMELYKKYKINPFSGCLPILLQMPIFIALYQALLKSIDLRGASFMWIRDLSSPEAIPLPISFPIIGDSINILPLVMVAAMVVQQKISTATSGAAVSEEQKQQQKIMLIIMPIMFGFIFYNMPSGLVLYWVINTVLTIVEQSAVLRKE